MRCAILDDDRAQAELIAGMLAQAGYSYQIFQHGRTLVNRLRQDTFDLLVLDWNMPEMSGIEVLQTVREGPHAAIPVLLVTSRTSDADVVEGLNAGADDYITKPLNAPIFLARVEALLRRVQLNRPHRAATEFGIYSFDTATETVHVDGEPVKLTAKELALAMTLFENLSRPLSRSYLLESIWGQNPESQTRTLDAHISRLRAKLNLRAENGYRIMPVYSYGYRLEPVSTEAVEFSG
jgi:DNA-binding response OmpR family regulator